MTPIEQLRALVAAHPQDARLDAYLEKVRRHAYKVTDADVRALRDAGVTEDEIFEQTAATAIAEGLRRLDAAEAAIG